MFKKEFSDEVRNKTREEFWSFDYKQRRLWIAQQDVQQVDKKRPRKKTRHTYSQAYMLKTMNKDDVLINFSRPVCKTFFLSTLEYMADQVITSLTKCGNADGRDGHINNKLSDTISGITYSPIILV